MSACSFPDCGYPHYGHGLCRAHLWQEKHGIPLRPVRRLTRHRSCGVEGCDRKHKAHGWCATHLSQWQKGHTPGEPRPRRSKKPAALKSLPSTWEKSSTAPARVKAQQSALMRTVVFVPPTQPATLAAVLVGLRDRGCEDLAEALGVTPDQIRAEAARWAWWEGTAA